jgi:hypothetical protein
LKSSIYDTDNDHPANFTAFNEIAYKAISLDKGSFSGSDEDLGIIGGSAGVNGVTLG